MSEAEDINFSCQYGNGTFTIAIDIGGTLAKVVFSPLESNKLKFYTVETERIQKFVWLLHSIVDEHNDGVYHNVQIIATGGGAYKFYDLLMKEFPGVKKIERFDEMQCLIKGLDAFIHEIPNEVFTYNDQDGARNVVLPRNSSQLPETYPYLLVNIGSGVSILKVEAQAKFTRIGGSSLGGGTLWGLLSLITGAQTYDQMLDWTREGDNSNVDMLVGDIYGSDYGKIGLKSSNIASSFGKVFQNRRGSISRPNSTSSITTSPHSPIANTTSHTDITRRNRKFKNPDICKSLLYAISNNIGQIAYLQAKVHNVQNIYFGGSYIRGHLITMNTLSYAINFWSQGSKQAFFLKHEGYLGAMGAFLSA
ncbi:CAB1 (YDR531W) [Zygosaccharomyces parabailii]|uniref:ZYBA0S14-02432g1_1 n=1 Tax=Zygosaccharomyces bailii (strain CLIB 213 / ATCC 58445 / CBS 680 / BCRC 21525 / NBRC 1098 / NCYC 1416 / NRRL Y-2227) TaxID=1333698 RepID=A0A8J2TB60_ZYGB2|nr:CAB1 (YDR531W) [Zygosaccharomyces parabailii]CDF91842.1 ZYBA0S14-02432g1_1 [Zygosaccharomyces bailii CLIB 213]SJM88149.1 probable Pantothenate kinase CAB1 [Zygosaccharomyces bailii]